MADLILESKIATSQFNVLSINAPKDTGSGGIMH